MYQDHTRGKGRLLTPGEVAERFRVDPKTVTRWGNTGKLACIRTPGGHRRYYEADVEVFLSGLYEAQAAAPDVA